MVKECSKDLLVGEGEGIEQQADEEDDLFGDGGEQALDGNHEEFHDAEAEQDLAPKRVSPDPGKPTQSEIEEHNIDHMPYRGASFASKDAGRVSSTGRERRADCL